MSERQADTGEHGVCLGCSFEGEAEGLGWHSTSEHDPRCDGEESRCLSSCPVQVQCGPVVVREHA